MKTQLSKSIKRLRDIIGFSQEQFAVLISASNDTVVSWENGRIKKLSSELKHRIFMATGADVSHPGEIRTYLPRVKKYTKEYFEQWRKTLGRSDEKRAGLYADIGAANLKTLFQAAAKPGLTGGRTRLPAVLAAFDQWLVKTAADSKLETQVDDLLKQRPHFHSSLWPGKTMI